MIEESEVTQRKRFSESACYYDARHVHKNDQHYVALEYILGFIKNLNISNVLDVGCGTGRGIKYLIEKGILVKGIEPAFGMLEQAVKKNKLPRASLICASGDKLPFEDNVFDAVCEFGVLHHVENPDDVIKEMMRVAKKAVFVSDCNRFGQGNTFLRLTKFLLYKAKLWDFVNFVKNCGKKYHYEDDVLAYSYSIFDSYKIFAKWADRVILIPTDPVMNHNLSWLNPLFTSGQILLCAIKE
jgi:ubiquinone/menaquinone biosynthesis C-methylase UbiE